MTACAQEKPHKNTKVTTKLCLQELKCEKEMSHNIQHLLQKENTPTILFFTEENLTNISITT